MNIVYEQTKTAYCLIVADRSSTITEETIL